MKKITNFKLNLASGKTEEEEVEIKTRNFSEGDAATFWRKFLIDSGFKDNLGVALIPHPKYGELQYLTLFGIPIRTKFTLWQSAKDSDGGKAVLWIGERNTTGYEQIEHGIVVKGRMVPTAIFWYGLIVAPRKTFRVGTSVKEQEFVDFLLVPLDDIIKELEVSKDPCVNLRKMHRQKYAFHAMLETFKTKEIL
jgi:hypothetical protein